MKALISSFVPFTLLLLGIVAGVLYTESLAAEKSRAYHQKEVKATDQQPYNLVATYP